MLLNLGLSVTLADSTSTSRPVVTRCSPLTPVPISKPGLSLTPAPRARSNDKFPHQRGNTLVRRVADDQSGTINNQTP